ncbi:hypothetical protein NQL31_006281 [Lotmaria passim]
MAPRAVPRRSRWRLRNKREFVEGEIGVLAALSLSKPKRMASGRRALEVNSMRVRPGGLAPAGRGSVAVFPSPRSAS